MIVGLNPVVALLAIFIWLGLSRRNFDRQTRQQLFLLILVLLGINYSGVLG